MPHMPLAIYGPPLPPDAAPGTPPNFTLLAGATLTISNPATTGMIQPMKPPGGFSLTQFVPGFVPSQEVVSLFSRAAAYFDIELVKSVSIQRADANQPVQSENSPFITIVEMDTDGPPMLQITPFPNSLMQSPPLIPIQQDALGNYTLSVTNTDFDTMVGTTNFDFLLNYLVGAAGIPVQLSEPTPGLSSALASPMPSGFIGGQLQSLGEFIDGGNWVTPDQFSQLWTVGQLQGMAGNPIPDNQSCSDSHYP
jgi:hypothetical protein